MGPLRISEGYWNRLEVLANLKRVDQCSYFSSHGLRKEIGSDPLERNERNKWISMPDGSVQALLYLTPEQKARL